MNGKREGRRGRGLLIEGGEGFAEQDKNKAKLPEIFLPFLWIVNKNIGLSNVDLEFG